jgi:multiple sugar transport system permease protein
MYFSRVLINTIIWTASSVIIIVLINIFLALLLNQNFAGRNVFRIIILVLPWATPDIVAAVSWKWMYNSMYGLINNVLLQFKFPISQIDWLGAPNLALFSVILANIWKGYPIGTMIMLAAYQTIHPEIYEAAEIDGCTGLRSLFGITLPIIRSTLFSLLLISVIWTINYFPLIYIMTGGGPAHRTDTLVTIAYRESFTFLNFNKGSGIILLVFAVTCVFAFLYIKVLLGNGEKQD